MRKIKFYSLFIFLVASLQICAQKKYASPKPRLFLTIQDIDRAKQQAATDVSVTPSIKKLKADLKVNAQKWRKDFPAKNSGYTMKELFSKAKEKPSRPEFLTEATAFVLFPTEETAQILREKILVELGIRKALGSWRQLGIHESERLLRFIQAYDIVCETGLLSEKEKALCKEEIHNSARFLEAWTLENDLNVVYQGQTYCFNIKYFPAIMLGCVAMYYPDFEESPAWLAKAQDEVIRYFYTENFLDGAYGEGSIHYFHPVANAIINFIYASRNTGHADYMKDHAFKTAFSNFMHWRMNLTAPDGRKVAIGDAKRSSYGADYLEQAATLLNDPELAWCGRQILKLCNKDCFLSPFELLTVDRSITPIEPADLSANYIWSGYNVYRSSWEEDGNYLMFKWGPTFAGRREIERYAVIAGHAHEDCMEIEMHYKGIPMLVDGGYRGVYANYDTYGGYWKATISHNTVGLGNAYGYNRTDGKYLEHVQKHGKEFRYEKEQKNISQQTTRLLSYGDVTDATMTSAKAQTFDDVTHQRTVLWFRDSSLTLVYDCLESDYEQTYEWYLNPIGKHLETNNAYTFGDNKAKLDVIPLSKNQTINIISQGTKGLPEYYHAFRDNFAPEPSWDGPNARWQYYSLMTESQKKKNAIFFNMLIPYQGTNPYKEEKFGESGHRFASAQEEICVISKEESPVLSTDGLWSFTRKKNNKLVNYGIQRGHILNSNQSELIKSQLISLPWTDLYDPAITALVSLDTQRASFVLDPDPWNERLLLFNPKLEKDKEPALPIAVKVSFKVHKKPQKIVRLRSNNQMPELENEIYDQKINKGKFFTGKKNYDVIESRIGREILNFDYDEKEQIVSIILPHGFNQIVWE